jgi:hypothetical protein
MAVLGCNGLRCIINIILSAISFSFIGKPVMASAKELKELLQKESRATMKLITAGVGTSCFMV